MLQGSYLEKARLIPRSRRSCLELLHERWSPCLIDHPVDENCDERTDRRMDQVDTAESRPERRELFGNPDPEKRIGRNAPHPLRQTTRKKIVPENTEPLAQSQHR